MTSMLRAGRILSSDESNAITQTQNVDVNIKVQSNPKQDSNPPPSQHHNNGGGSGGITYQSSYPTIHPTNISPNFTNQPSGANFTLDQPAAATDQSSYLSVNPSAAPNQDLLNELQDLRIRNQFLELLLTAYDQNPLKINNLVIVNHRMLIDMIKLLTGADKIDLVLNEDLAVNCGCCADTDHDELIYIGRILVTRDGKTSDLKICYNEVYSEFVKFGVSLKLCCR